MKIVWFEYYDNELKTIQKYIKLLCKIELLCLFVYFYKIIHFFCKNAFCNRRTIFNLTFCLKTCLPQFSSWPVSLKPWLPCFLSLWWCRGLCRGRTFFWWRWILSFWSCLIISFVSCSLASGPSTINLDFSSVSSSLVSASGWFDSFPVKKKETCHYICTPSRTPWNSITWMCLQL